MPVDDVRIFTSRTFGARADARQRQRGADAVLVSKRWGPYQRSPDNTSYNLRSESSGAGWCLEWSRSLSKCLPSPELTHVIRQTKRESRAPSPSRSACACGHRVDTLRCGRRSNISSTARPSPWRSSSLAYCAARSGTCWCNVHNCAVRVAQALPRRAASAYAAFCGRTASLPQLTVNKGLRGD